MKNIIGIFLVILGVTAFLDFSNIAEIHFWSVIGDWWPIIFVLIGINGIKNKDSIYSIVIPIVLGLAWIGSNLDLLPFGVWDILIPVILVLIGLSLIFGRKKNKTEFSGEFDNSSDYLKVSAFFSGQKQRILNKNLKGGKIESFFGGIELDMRNVEFSKEFEVIDIDAVAGGVVLWLPENVQVVTEGKPFFGGVDNKLITPRVDDPIVVKITFTVFFGGIELKN